MKKQEVFEVAEVEQIQDDTWLVRGRAYADLKIGDVLFADAPRSRSPGELVVFRIMAISSYGSDMEVLYSVMTGDLTLCGRHGDRLQEAPVLVRLLQPGDQLVAATDSAS